LLVFLQTKPWLYGDVACFLPLVKKNTLHYTNSSMFYLYSTTLYVLHGLFSINVHTM